MTGQRYGGTPPVKIGPSVQIVRPADVDASPTLSSARDQFAALRDGIIAASGKAPSGTYIRRLLRHAQLRVNATATTIFLAMWVRPYTVDAGGLVKFGDEILILNYPDLSAAAIKGDATAVTLKTSGTGLDSVLQAVATALGL